MDSSVLFFAHYAPLNCESANVKGEYSERRCALISLRATPRLLFSLKCSLYHAFTMSFSRCVSRRNSWCGYYARLRPLVYLAKQFLTFVIIRLADKPRKLRGELKEYIWLEGSVITFQEETSISNLLLLSIALASAEYFLLSFFLFFNEYRSLSRMRQLQRASDTWASHVIASCNWN